MDLQIEGRDVEVAPELAENINARVAELQPSAGVVHVRVTLTKHEHRSEEDTHETLIVVQIPRHTITARKTESSFEESIREAFAALETELQRVQEKRASHEVRTNAPPEHGVVSQLFPEDGYGFILLDDGTQVYFHRHAVHDMVFEQMDGMEVTLNVEPGEKGPQATTVNPIEPLQHYVDKGAAA